MPKDWTKGLTFNVCTAGKKFSIPRWSRALGPKRKTEPLSRMSRSLELRTGVKSLRHSRVVLESNAERGKSVNKLCMVSNFEILDPD